MQYNQTRHYDESMLEADIEATIRDCLTDEPHCWKLSDSEENIQDYKRKMLKWVRKMRDENKYSIADGSSSFYSNGIRVYKNVSISSKKHGYSVAPFMCDVLHKYHRLIGCDWENY